MNMSRLAAVAVAAMVPIAAAVPAPAQIDVGSGLMCTAAVGTANVASAPAQRFCGLTVYTSVTPTEAILQFPSTAVAATLAGAKTTYSSIVLTYDNGSPSRTFNNCSAVGLYEGMTTSVQFGVRGHSAAGRCDCDDGTDCASDPARINLAGAPPHKVARCAGGAADARQRSEMRHSTRRLAGVPILAVLLAACGGGGGTAASPPVPVGVGASSPSAAPSATPSSEPVSSGREPTVAGCQVFPSDNPWNTDVSSLPVDTNSAAYLASMNASTTFLHPDFGSNPTYGIPYTSVPGSQAFVPITFTLYGSQSNPGPYPIPPNAPVEGGPSATGDRHVIVVDSGNCELYEMYAAQYVGPGWDAGSGAVFNLSSNALRPDYWTSADAAGLPILAGLARYDEAAQNGAIYHALRFTVHATQAGFIHPATHYASSSTNPALPPMGLRVRLKASFDVSTFAGASRAVLVALQHYGMFVADNGSDWYISGSTDTRWSDTDLNQLKTVPASAFEVVQGGPIIH